MITKKEPFLRIEITADKERNLPRVNTALYLTPNQKGHSKEFTLHIRSTGAIGPALFLKLLRSYTRGLEDTLRATDGNRTG
jgi:hypothetical protein